MYSWPNGRPDLQQMPFYPNPMAKYGDSLALSFQLTLNAACLGSFAQSAHTGRLGPRSGAGRSYFCRTAVLGSGTFSVVQGGFFLFLEGKVVVLSSTGGVHASTDTQLGPVARALRVSLNQ